MKLEGVGILQMGNVRPGEAWICTRPPSWSQSSREDGEVLAVSPAVDSLHQQTDDGDQTFA